MKLKGHKPGCACVGCSPATRRRGMAALKRSPSNGRRVRNPHADYKEAGERGGNLGRRIARAAGQAKITLREAVKAAREEWAKTHENPRRQAKASPDLSMTRETDAALQSQGYKPYDAFPTLETARHYAREALDGRNAISARIRDEGPGPRLRFTVYYRGGIFGNPPRSYRRAKSPDYSRLSPSEKWDRLDGTGRFYIMTALGYTPKESEDAAQFKRFKNLPLGVQSAIRKAYADFPSRVHGNPRRASRYTKRKAKAFKMYRGKGRKLRNGPRPPCARCRHLWSWHFKITRPLRGGGPRMEAAACQVTGYARPGTGDKTIKPCPCPGYLAPKLSNPLTRQEAAGDLKYTRHLATWARKIKRHGGSPERAAFYRGRAVGVAGEVSQHGATARIRKQGFRAMTTAASGYYQNPLTRDEAARLVKSARRIGVPARRSTNLRAKAYSKGYVHGIAQAIQTAGVSLPGKNRLSHRVATLANPARFIGSNVTLYTSSGKTFHLGRSKIWAGPDGRTIIVTGEPRQSRGRYGRPAVFYPIPLGGRIIRIDYDNRPKALDAYGRPGRFRHDFKVPVIAESVKGKGQGAYVATLRGNAQLWGKQ